MFTTQFNDSLILITIISWDYLNLQMNMLVMSQYQAMLSNITNVAPGGSANKIAVSYQIKLFVNKIQC